MRIGVVGSRSLRVRDLGTYLPKGAERIISGGARGVDADAKQYAADNGIPYTEYLPDYARYGKGAPLRRNLQIIENCDMLCAFWDGSSRGTGYTIRVCKENNIPVQIWLAQSNGGYVLLL